MSWSELITYIIALAFVLALILAFAWGYKWFLARHPNYRRGSRLKVIESRAVDVNNRLVLVKRDDVEHLLLVGRQTTDVVETGIKPPKTTKKGDHETSS